MRECWSDTHLGPRCPTSCQGLPLSQEMSHSPPQPSHLALTRGTMWETLVLQGQGAPQPFPGPSCPLPTPSAILHAPSSRLLPHPGPAQPRERLAFVPPSSCQDEPSCLLPAPSPFTRPALSRLLPPCSPSGLGCWGDKTALPSRHFPAGRSPHWLSFPLPAPPHLGLALPYT